MIYTSSVRDPLQGSPPLKKRRYIFTCLLTLALAPSTDRTHAHTHQPASTSLVCMGRAAIEGRGHLPLSFLSSFSIQCNPFHSIPIHPNPIPPHPIPSATHDTLLQWCFTASKDDDHHHQRAQSTTQRQAREKEQSSNTYVRVSPPPFSSWANGIYLLVRRTIPSNPTQSKRSEPNQIESIRIPSVRTTRPSWAGLATRPGRRKSWAIPHRPRSNAS